MASLFLACKSTFAAVSGALDPVSALNGKAGVLFAAVCGLALGKGAVVGAVVGGDGVVAVQEVAPVAVVLDIPAVQLQDVLESLLCAQVMVARDQWSEPVQASFLVLDCFGRIRSIAILPSLLVWPPQLQSSLRNIGPHQCVHWRVSWV